MSNNVIRYTPQAVKSNGAFNNMYLVHKSEIDNLHVWIKHVVDNAYIDTMDEDRIKEWEEVLLLSTDTSKPPTLRIDIIKDYLGFLPPITRYTLEDLLINKYGEGNFYLKIIKERFEVIVGVETEPDDLVEYMYGWLKKEGVTYTELELKTYSILMKYRGSQSSTTAQLLEQSFKKFLRKIIPANILLTFAIMYMYSYIRGLYTYGELEQYTYKYLSQYSDYDCDDRNVKPSLVHSHTLELSPQYWQWHTEPYVEDEVLNVDEQDITRDGTKLIFTVPLKEEYE